MGGILYEKIRDEESLTREIRLFRRTCSLSNLGQKHLSCFPLDVHGAYLFNSWRENSADCINSENFPIQTEGCISVVIFPSKGSSAVYYIKRSVAWKWVFSNPVIDFSEGKVSESQTWLGKTVPGAEVCKS